MSRSGRAFAVVAVFALIGPLVGALVFGVLVGIVTFVEDAGAGFASVSTGAGIFLAAVAFYPLAYLVGGVQALFVGLVTAVAAWRSSGDVPWWIPLTAALAAGGLVASRNHESWAMTAILLAVHILPALACWALLRRALGWR